MSITKIKTTNLDIKIKKKNKERKIQLNNFNENHIFFPISK
jgi:hypothetical protein